MELENHGRPESLYRGTGYRFRWILQVDREPAGWILLAVTSWDQGIAEISYSLSSAFRQQGLMSKALKPFLNDIFARTTLRRIEAQSVPENEASCKLLRRLGFILEKTISKGCTIRGQDFDCCVFAVEKPSSSHGKSSPSPAQLEQIANGWIFNQRSKATKRSRTFACAAI